MRIVLQKGKQKELIESAKKGRTWKTLAEEINHCPGYVIGELKNEKRYLSEEDYEALCKIAGNNFNKFVIDKLNDNWGQFKGGSSSSGNTKKFIEPIESEKLAELFGIILGDGHVEKIKRGSR